MEKPWQWQEFAFFLPRLRDVTAIVAHTPHTMTKK
jgi:hypothetical protein